MKMVIGSSYRPIFCIKLSDEATFRCKFGRQIEIERGMSEAGFSFFIVCAVERFTVSG